MSCRPSITMPPPTPVPQKTPRNESKPRPAPKRCSASTATLTSLPIRHGPPELGGERRPERERRRPSPSMFATWSTVPDSTSIEPGAPTPIPARPIGSTPASSSAARSASASSKATASGPPLRGVSRRALPSTVDSPSVTTAWIFVPPRSSPPFIRVTTAIARPRRSACGSPARSIPRPCAARRRAAAPAARTRGRSPAPRRRSASSAVRARSTSVIPFGHEASPSAQAASSMLWAARPASNSTGPFPCTRTATTRPAPRTFSGHRHRARELLDPSPPGRHDERPGLRVPRRAGEPARRRARAASARAAAAPAACAARRDGWRSRAACPCRHPSALHGNGVTASKLAAMAQPVDQETVSLLRWLRRQLRQPTPERERLEAAVANDDPAEARRLLAPLRLRRRPAPARRGPDRPLGGKSRGPR